MLLIIFHIQAGTWWYLIDICRINKEDIYAINKKNQRFCTKISVPDIGLT